MLKINSSFVLPFIIVSVIVGKSQDPLRFQDEVKQLTAGDSTISKKKIILFVGSSSIVMWASLTKDFPNHNTLNRGFGGSEMTDLIYFVDQLIVPYKPSKIFIYEGDNDLSNGKSPDEIAKHFQQLLSLIREKLSQKTQVYFISPKPSIARWELKPKYDDLNQKLKAIAKQNKRTTFIDMWAPMLEADGTVKKDLFIEDGLHMNAKGYAIWAEVVRAYLK
jgi:lysophospholipase L1-like esterase